jgi:hypothetical protein
VSRSLTYISFDFPWNALSLSVLHVFFWGRLGKTWSHRHWSALARLEGGYIIDPLVKVLGTYSVEIGDRRSRHDTPDDAGRHDVGECWR